MERIRSGHVFFTSREAAQEQQYNRNKKAHQTLHQQKKLKEKPREEVINGVNVTESLFIKETKIQNGYYALKYLGMEVIDTESKK